MLVWLHSGVHHILCETLSSPKFDSLSLKLFGWDFGGGKGLNPCDFSKADDEVNYEE